MSKVNLIILARTEEPIDLTFYKTMLRQNNLLYEQAVVILFSEVEQFIDFLSGMPDDYTFVLMVHPGLLNSTKGEDAIIIPQEMRVHGDFKNLKFNFLSREGKQGQSHNGEKLYHANFLADEDLSTFPLNRMGDLRNKQARPVAEVAKPELTTVDSGHPEFAVVTALYEDEFKVYEPVCDLDAAKHVVNAKMARFKEQRRLIYGTDYTGTFYLAHQQRMGLVDAAVHASQIISLLEPDFLLMSGVCGGRSPETSLYDVIIPTVVHDYATGKFKEGAFESLEYKTRTNIDLFEFLDRRKDDIVHNMRSLIDPSRKKLLGIGFKIIINEFACGPWVVKTDGFIDKMGYDHEKAGEKKDNYVTLPVKNISKHIKGLEMESYGILRTAEVIQKPYSYTLVAKSVMDFTNENKRDGEHGEIKSNAAYVSYLAIRAMMPLLLEFKKEQTGWK